MMSRETTTLLLLSDETCIDVNLLLECKDLIQAIKENKTLQEMLSIINNNF